MEARKAVIWTPGAPPGPSWSRSLGYLSIGKVGVGGGGGDFGG
jgi:hypothetical protein